MECERLVKLVKTWYLQVKDEALAPARMVAFMQKHIAECPVCLVDDEVQAEVDRITRIVLPPSKLPKPKQGTDEEENEGDEAAEDDEENSENDDDESEDDDEEVSDDDDFEDDNDNDDDDLDDEED